MKIYEKRYKLVGFLDSMKTLIIVILAVLILGLYFYTNPTKELITLTGEFVKNKVVSIIN